MKYDFSGWATKANIKCSDGRVIMHNAFADNDGTTVPLVWNHQHSGPDNILGHALLENRGDGVYAYCTFNDNDEALKAKELVKHGDVDKLSIWANNLQQEKSSVIHGTIRELSLVLAGANPGAYIDTVMIHGMDMDADENLCACFEQKIELYHADKKGEDEMSKEVETTEETVEDVINTMSEKQQNAMWAVVAGALEEAGVDLGAEDEDDDSETDDEGDEMKHNVFDDEDRQDDTLMHSAMQTIIADGKRFGSLKESFIQHSQEYGIENIDYLFPDYKNLENEPKFIKRTPDAWVDVVMNGVHHTPFSRIKMMFADITQDEARAKGYTKGKLKKEEVFSLLKRTVDPTTIYKKQKLDRDDIVDITDMNVVAWLKSEMRMMLDEEIARAIVFGDGRSSLSEDKISETNIIPIVADAPLYSMKFEIIQDEDESYGHAFIRTAVKSQDTYEGSGNTILFTAASNVTDMLLMEDGFQHRLYKDLNDLALAIGVNRIVKVPASIIPEGVAGVIVDLRDYNVGADKGGAVNMFDDFDIDYNQQKYLIETRCSGALTKPYSAIVLTYTAE